MVFSAFLLGTQSNVENETKFNLTEGTKNVLPPKTVAVKKLHYGENGPTRGREGKNAVHGDNDRVFETRKC